MSIIPKNDKRNNLNNIKEALILREIFSIIEDKNLNKNSDNKSNKNDDLFAKYKIHNIKFTSNIGINTLSKNRYKIKIKKLLNNKLKSKEN